MEFQAERVACYTAATFHTDKDTHIRIGHLFTPSVLSTHTYICFEEMQQQNSIECKTIQ